MYFHSFKEFLYGLLKIFKEKRFFYSVKYLWWIVLDRIRGVDFVKNEGYEKIGTSQERSSVYQATRDNTYLYKIMKGIPIKDTDAILDLGCGKGYMLKIFSKYAFFKVGGVELSERLCEIANKNIRKEKLGKCIVYHADAAEFLEYDEYTHIYMFNPFPAIVMEKVMENIKKSILRVPRNMTIIYKGAFCHDIIVGNGVFELTDIVEGKTLSYYVYKSIL
ncbi:class I SAM-dependent methyltransferase [Parablautia muri]|uniref:Class I SAM-dependent methyltransferase n=1 Tax=Parablautia muri TaxID=2320879 RepID=A0A9X5GQQ9_9FIRM|nr:class I SAM-dependent methyltransferase [Parablautia muri]NBJ91361.1 class I SAM-dependent methyltransferase [Parablautia muri]